MKRGRYKNNLRGYDAYKNLYREQESKMSSKGYHMKDRLMTKDEWEVTYLATKYDRQDEVLQGKRKTVGDVNRQLVKEQTYTYSVKQAKGYQQYLKSQGRAVSVNDIRASLVNIDFNMIHEREATLRSQGFNSANIAFMISQEFFGS